MEEDELDDENSLKYPDFFELLYNENLRDRLVITPLIDTKGQIGDGIVDLRLGTEFILTRKTRFSNLNVSKYKKLAQSIMKYQEKINIKFKDSLVLHPNQFILGCTLEYIKLPDNLIGYIIGRSSWGRLGLIIATATLINPGFAGVITLELTNVGEVPINLFPGLRIAQLSLHKCEFKNVKTKKAKGRYFGSTGPNFSRIYEDTDLVLIKKESSTKIRDIGQ